MEDWQLDLAQFSEGLCTDSPETFLENLETKFLSGEIAEYEMIQLYRDHLTKQRKRKVNIPNLFQFMLDPNKTESELKRNYKFCINALTSATLSAMLSHVAGIRAGRILPPDVPTDPRNEGQIASRSGESTLDARNADDLAAESETFRKGITEELGFTSTMPAFEIAEICDGIRHKLYKDFSGLVDLLPPENLNREPKITKQHVLERPNFDQPMSAEFNLNYRVLMSTNVDPILVARGVRMYHVAEDFVREALLEQGRKDAARLKDLAPTIITEIESFDSPYSEEGFGLLPLDTQLRIGTKIGDSLNKEYKRLLPIAIRSGDLSIGTDLKYIEENFKEIEEWKVIAEKAIREAKLQSPSPD